MTKIDYRDQTIIVTGASSGLGASFARELASRGANLVLVARREDRLQDLAGELKAAHGITVTTLARDLGQPDAGRALRAELEGRSIGVTGLVNNAGFGTHSAFSNEDPNRLQAMIALNVAALVDLTHAFIEPIRAAESGVLINVASVLGYQPTPFLSTYGATKAFVLNFTESLWEESRGTRMRVLAVSPGPMRTEFFDAAGSQSADYGARRVTPEQVVRAALKTLDRRSTRPSIITNGRPLVAAGRFLPRRRVANFMGWLQRRATGTALYAPEPRTSEPTATRRS
jgi:short-subunit dehydrogenase